MKVVKYFLQNKVFTHLLLVLVLFGGVFAYTKMGKLEDAPFTIKQALVVTSYPGASPMEVQKQVTDVLAESIQSLDDLYYLKTENREGLSKITVYVKKEIRADKMQQLWDKLRRKVNDVQPKLPKGAGPSLVKDDFGDVLGVFYGLSGEGYSYRELEDHAKNIKNSLLKIKDVGRVEIFGAQTPTIDVLVSPAAMTQRGITTNDIAAAFEKQNRVVDGGAIETEDNRIRIDVTGSFSTIEEIENMTVVSKNGESYQLKDVAQVSESYLKPARSIMRINGADALGIAVATTPNGNVVNMSKGVKECMDSFSSKLPDGLSISCIYDQGYESDVANDGFIINLIVSVLTVVALLLFFIGLKNGLLVGSGLVFSIFATLIYMQATGIALQRMSLAAIIIAMGMLVDNAIVVTDLTLVNMQRGMRKRVAILRAVSTTALPLLAATAIAILTFMPVYLSPHVSGELLSSLFIVIAVSLSFSWIFAMMQTPFYMEQYVARPRREDLKAELNQGKLYDWFRGTLDRVIRRKYAVVTSLVVLLALSVYGFRFIPKVFMPQLNKQYFTLDMWMPEGTRIERTDKEVDEVVRYLQELDQVEMVSSYVGQTPPRYYLANSSFGPQPNYANCLIKTPTPEKARELQKVLYESLPHKFPELFVRANRFELNFIPEALIEARFCGNDPKVLDSLTNVALTIMRNNPKVTNARNEWGNMTMIARPEFDPIRAGLLGISKSNLVEATKSVNDGLPVGIYRDEEKKVPVLLKTNQDKQMGSTQLADFAIWNGKGSAPLSQATKSIRMEWEYPLVKTYNRELTMAAMCDVKPDYTMKEVHAEIRAAIENIKLPQGYSFFWDSQYKDQNEAMAALTKYFPLAFLLLVIILVALFRNIKQPLIILLILPLSIIGIVFGMLLTGFDFGFFCIAGWLGLLGMIIKNVIVLIDEVNIQLREGESLRKAVIESTVSRARPVIMAAGTTILGMVPLLFDVVFNGMATTIVFGLTFATLLTLFVTPALIAIFYKLK